MDKLHKESILYLFSLCLRHLCIVFECERVCVHTEVIGHHPEIVYLTESWILNSGLQVCQHSTFTTELLHCPKPACFKLTCLAIASVFKIPVGFTNIFTFW